jgi:predicted transcriptional regulator
MRTTINLDDNLLADLKQMAARTGRTMTAIIEDAVRQTVVTTKALTCVSSESMQLTDTLPSHKM